MSLSKFEKLKISMEYYLIGRGYLVAKRAFEFSQAFHTGLRKDGITPEFQHPLEIAHYLRTFDRNENMENPIAGVLLHDTREDFNISNEELKEKFNEEVFQIVWCLSKKFRKDKITNEEYYRVLCDNKDAALAKAIDRHNNLKSMVGVFSLSKQKEYIRETIEYTLPMMKKARKYYPEYEAYFENVKCNIEIIIHLIEEIHREKETKK